jgi:hypothetical protein
MSPEDEDRARDGRRAARRDWPIRVYKLGEEPPDDLSATTTAEERLAMMWPLARQAWAFTGRPFPEYARRQTPIRVAPSPLKTRGTRKAESES